MNWINTILILLTAYVVVFLESSVTFFRNLTGAQPDFLPGLIIYVSLSAGVADLFLLSLLGGLLFDALSANPLGVSVIPLFLAGFILRRYRILLVRQHVHTQWILGAAIHAGVPLGTLLLLWSLDQHPLLGWFSLWQWFVMTLLGAALTPVWFQLFDRLTLLMNYQPIGGTTFRPDREIKRGRR